MATNRISGTSAALFLYGFGLQTAQGTAVTPTAVNTYNPRWLDGSDLNPQIEVGKLMEGDQSLQIGYAYKKKQFWVWNLTFYPRAHEMGGILYPLLGAQSDGFVPLGSSGPGTHLATLKQVPAWLTLFGQFNGKQVTLQDAVVDKVKFSCKAGEPLKIEASGYALASSAFATAGLTASYDTVSLPSTLTNQTFTVDAFTAGTDAHAVAVAEYNVQVARNLDPSDLYTQGLGPEGFVYPQFMVDFDYTSVWQDWQQYSGVYDGTTTLGATLDSASLLSGAQFAIAATWPVGPNGSGAYTGTFTVQNAVYTEAKLLPKVDGKAMRVKFAGFGTKNIATGTDSLAATMSLQSTTTTRQNIKFS